MDFLIFYRKDKSRGSKDLRNSGPVRPEDSRIPLKFTEGEKNIE